ncbi:MAG: penicillin-insensitive murein endopeptidase [Gammaproteobacteria bacterium]|nr:penicillin-insensitive murein endopeptidase [Gammaproteobacteria bacterium]
MGKRLSIALALLATAGLVQASASPWAKIETATPGPPRVIGKVSYGCISGAEALPETGVGYVSIRRHRNRFYGHPETLKLVQGLGEELAKRRQDRKLMIGDLSQPRGGLMSSMHRSHQNGVDVDVWFTLTESVEHAKKLAPEGNDPPSMLQADKRLTSQHWGEDQLFLLKTAAENPQVERIFINPGIKLAVCASQGPDAPWLQKLRPWHGHDAHFHVRLKCPEGSPDCEQQAPLPPGSGCGAELASWFKPKPAVKPTKEAEKPPAKPVKPAPPPIPPQCRPVLAQGTDAKLAEQRADFLSTH